MLRLFPLDLRRWRVVAVAPQDFIDLSADEDRIAAEIEPEHDKRQSRQAAVHGDGVEVGDIDGNPDGG